MTDDEVREHLGDDLQMLLALWKSGGREAVEAFLALAHKPEEQTGGEE